MLMCCAASRSLLTINSTSNGGVSRKSFGLELRRKRFLHVSGGARVAAIPVSCGGERIISSAVSVN